MESCTPKVTVDGVVPGTVSYSHLFSYASNSTVREDSWLDLEQLSLRAASDFQEPPPCTPRRRPAQELGFGLLDGEGLAGAVGEGGRDDSADASPTALDDPRLKGSGEPTIRACGSEELEEEEGWVGVER